MRPLFKDFTFDIFCVAQNLIITESESTPIFLYISWT